MGHIDKEIRFLENLKAEGHSHVALFVIDRESLLYLPEFNDIIKKHFGDEKSEEAVEARWVFAELLWPYISDTVEDKFFAEVSQDPVTYSLASTFRELATEIPESEAWLEELLLRASANTKKGPAQAGSGDD